MASAPAEKSIEILSQELTCSLCSEYYAKPKTLECCHYYCQECLGGFASEKEPVSEPQVISCPACGVETNLPPGGVAALPDVRFVDRLKELHDRMAAVQGGKEAKCQSCSTELAAFFCRQCPDLACGGCAASHRATSGGHSVSSLEELRESGARAFPMKPFPPSGCFCGSGAAVSTFCSDCRQLACENCAAAKHCDHRADPIKKAASQARRQLQQCLFPLRIAGQQLAESLAKIRNAEREIASQGEDAERTIRAFFDEAISCLESERETALAKAAGLVGKKLGALREQEQELARASSEVQSVVEFSKQSAELVNDEEVLESHDGLLSRIKDECSKCKDTADQEPCEVANMAVQTMGAREIINQLSRERVSVYLFPTDNSRVHRAEVGKETTHCVMESFDPLFTPHLASFSASLVSVVDDSVIEGSVTPVGRGLYEVHYTPRVRGRHKLWVKRDGEAISNTPFPVLATISPVKLGERVHCMEQLKHPYSVAISSQSQLFVTESGGDSIQKFRRRGEDVAAEIFAAFHQTKSPTGMAVDGDGFCYIVNSSTHTLAKFNKHGELMAEVGGEGSERGEFYHPSGVAVVGERVYVCDRKNNRIKVYSRDLKLLEVFGTQGCGEGELNWPYNIASDEGGLLYVADTDNHRIQVFDECRKFLHSFGSCGNEEGSLMRPTGVCVGKNGHLYVTEYSNHRVSVFARDGSFVTSFGSHGSGRGQFCYPVGITIDCDGFVYICDQGNNRVQVF